MVQNSDASVKAELAQSPARPVRQGRSRATRDRLLEAAVDIFAAKGFERAALSEIASQAGCSVGSVYFRFHDKDALFQAALTRFLAEAGQRWLAISRAQEERAAPPRERIAEAVRFLSDALAARPGLVRGLVERVGGKSPGDEPLLAGVRAVFIADLARFAKTAAPERSDADCDFAAAVAFQIVTGFTVNALLNPLAPAPLPSEKAAAALEEAVTRYLVP